MATPERNPESIVREIKRKTRRVFNAEEKIRIVLEGLPALRRGWYRWAVRRGIIHLGPITR